jgi:hypothetical protein
MNTAHRDAIDRAERSGYLPALRRLARQSCVPFWWHGMNASNQYRILHNGTVCFVETGTRKIAVTANHVYSEYLRNKQANPDLVCQFGGTPFSPEGRLIDRSASLDVATFDVSDVAIGMSGGSFHSTPKWPTEEAKEGDVLLLGGYPGRLREEGEVTAELPFQWFIGAASSVSPFNVALHLDLANLHQPLSPLETLNRDLGGMSGGPVFRFVSSPIERLEVVGFIYEYQEGYELMLARPSNCLREDGTLLPF